MTGSAGPDAAQVEAVAHTVLLLGRLLLQNGADTGRVMSAVERVATAFGCEGHVLVTYESLLVTLVAGAHVRTRIGHRVPAMNVGLAAIEAVGRVVDDAARGVLGLDGVRRALEAVERRPPEYNHWLVAAALGLTAASLSRLFGGDWPAFAASWLAGFAGTWLRQALGRRGANPVAVAFAVSCFGGVIGGAAVRLGVSTTPSLCLIAPGMIIVPGVPFINGCLDMMRNLVTLGLSRLSFAALVTVTIGMGLFAATLVTGAAIPVEEPARVIPVAEDAVFSALAAAGYALLFDVRARIAWACVLCGVVSHTTRTIGVHLGVDLVAGTLIGALAAGFLAQGFAWHFRAPAVAFAFPGVVAMVPGSYAFRAVVGALAIERGAATPALAQATLALGIDVVLMVAAIAVGVAAPAVLGGRARMG